MQKQDYYNEFFEIGQQKINFSFFKLCLPDDDPVYPLKNRLVRHRFLKCTGVQTVVVANIKPNACINIMRKKMLRKTKS